jgi:hypothetical protein
MSASSRRITPKPRAHIPIWAWMPILGLATLLCIISSTLAIAFLAFVSAGIVWLKYSEFSIRTRRKQESICTFIRSLECQAIDPLLVRSVYDELQTYMNVPLRPDDRLCEDLRIEQDDIYDIIVTVGRRAGRSIGGVSHDPLWGHISTVRSLVELLSRQPRTPP